MGKAGQDEGQGGTKPIYLRIRKGKVKTTRECGQGEVFLDYDERGRLLGVEVLATILETEQSGKVR